MTKLNYFVILGKELGGSLKNLHEKFREIVLKDKRARFRDQRGHSASQATNCLRDQFWKITGEEETNPMDYMGHMRTFVGRALEAGLREEFFKNMHRVGEHYLADQVSFGQTKPVMWDGYADLLMASRPPSPQEKAKRYLVEIKVLTGIGTDFMVMNTDPKAAHMVQLGLYLKDAFEKGLTSEACLFYYGISNSCFGSVVNFTCCWLPDTQEIKAYHVGVIDTGSGKTIAKNIDLRYNVKELALKRLEVLDKYVADKITPDPEFQYKYALDGPEVAATSNAQIKKAAEGSKVLGDWQVAYSPYKDKQLEVDGISKGYTDAEIKTLEQEYKRRVPKQRTFK